MGGAGGVCHTSLPFAFLKGRVGEEDCSLPGEKWRKAALLFVSGGGLFLEFSCDFSL